MHLNDARIDISSGFPIVTGQIAFKGLDLPNDQLKIPEHNFLLVEQHSYQVHFRPVTSIEKLQNGFYRIVREDIYLQVDRLQEFLSNFFSHGYSRGDIQFSGDEIGYVRTNSQSYYGIFGYNIRTELTSGGLQLNIKGNFGKIQSREKRRIKPPPLSEISFEIDCAIPWATLFLKEIHTGASNYAYFKGKSEPLGVTSGATDPRKFSDLLITDGGFLPFVRGRLGVYGQGRHEERAKDSSSENVIVNINSHGLKFIPGKPERLENGFCRNSGRLDNLWFTISGINKESFHEQWLSVEPLVLLRRGGRLGAVDHEWSSDARTDFPYIVRQWILDFEFRAIIAPAGLHLFIRGNLKDYSPFEYERYKEDSGRDLQPWETFEIEAALPWALLVVRLPLLVKGDRLKFLEMASN